MRKFPFFLEQITDMTSIETSYANIANFESPGR